MEKLRSEEKGLVLPTRILKVAEINLNEKLILCGIAMVAKEEVRCKIPNEKLAEILCLNVRTVANIMTNLVKKGYIQLKVYKEPLTRKTLGRVIVLTTKFLELMAGLSWEKSSYKKHKNNDKDKNKIEKRSKKGYNVINQCEEQESSWLNKPQYSRVTRVTKRNIQKNLPHISEERFICAFKKIDKLLKDGVVRNFEGALYTELKGEWEELKSAKESDTVHSSFICGNKREESNLLEEKIKWFKSCFAGIKYQDYLSVIERIPFDILKKNRKRLGVLDTFQFSREIKKLERGGEINVGNIY